MFSRRIPKYQLFLTAIMGCVGGIYVWKPELDRHFAAQQKENIEKAASSEMMT